MSILSASPAAVRAQRAQEQAFNYGLFAQPTGVFSVVARTGEKVYETTATTCTCPDFEHRGSKQTPPVPCKHQHLVRAEQVRKDEEARARAADRARIARNMANDFPLGDW